MSKKYELTDERNTGGLYRIRALRDITRCGVRAGDLGGWVAEEGNLAQDGDCWVSSEAKVYGDARVFGNAKVYGRSIVSGDAEVYGGAEVYGYAIVDGSALVSGSAQVSGDAAVSGNAQVFGDANVFETCHVLSGSGLPSGDWTLFRTMDGHALKIGCWTGTTASLRELVAGDKWPSARGEQIEQRRPMLLALADMCDAVIATWLRRYR